MRIIRLVCFIKLQLFGDKRIFEMGCNVIQKMSFNLTRILLSDKLNYLTQLSDFQIFLSVLQCCDVKMNLS